MTIAISKPMIFLIKSCKKISFNQLNSVNVKTVLGAVRLAYENTSYMQMKWGRSTSWFNSRQLILIVVIAMIAGSKKRYFIYIFRLHRRLGLRGLELLQRTTEKRPLEGPG